MSDLEKHNELREKIKTLEEKLNSLLAENEKYQSFFSDAPLGIFRATVEGSFIEVNNTFAQLLGYNNSDEVIEQVDDISQQIYVDSKERKNLIKELVKNNKDIIKYETNFKKKNGIIFPIHLTLKLIKNELGKEPYISGMIEDISERKLYQDNLLTEKHHLRTLIDNIPDYIYLKDKFGHFITANTAFINLLKLKSVDELEKWKNEDAKKSEFLQNFLKNDSLILAGGEASLDKEVFGYDNNLKTTIYTYTSKIPVIDRKGVIQGLIGIGRNITELKEAEQKIISSEANLNAVIESTKSAIWAIDRKYRLITSNSHFHAFCEDFFNTRITLGQNIFSIVPEKLKSKWKKIYAKALKGEHWIEQNAFPDNENIIYFEFSISPIIDNNSNIAGVTVLATDVTERKITEEAIKENEERFRQLAENTNDAFILYTKNNILYVNPAFEKIFGISIVELIKNPEIISECIHPEDKKNYALNKKKELSSKSQESSFQYRIKRPKGDIRRLWSRTYPVYNDRGRIYRYISVISDITEQIELEQILSKAKNQQKAILDNIPYLAWLKDNEGRYISVNEPFAEFHDLDPNEIIGKTDYDINPKNLADKYFETDKKVMDKGKRQLIEEIETVGRKKRWKETFKAPIFNEDGKIIGLTGISRDISGRKIMEETLKEREEQITALLQNSSDAISIVNRKAKIIFESSHKNKISDFTNQELLGKSIYEIIHPDDLENFRKAFEEVLEKPGKQVKREYRSLHKNKKWIYVESIFSNQLKNKAIRGIILNSRDISERKMGELKERVYHDNLIFLSNSALDLLSLSAKDDIFQFIGDKLSAYLENVVVVVSSYLDDIESFKIQNFVCAAPIKQAIIKFLGKNPVGIVFPKTAKYSDVENAGTVNTILKDEINKTGIGSVKSLNINALVEKLKVHKIYNISLARHNKLLGNIIILTLNKTIIKFKHIIETFVHQVSVALQRSQLEYELIRAKDKAEESDKIKTAFLANMSHEIRTPMNGILGFAEMLNDEELNPDTRKKYLEIIHSNGKMLINLIDDIIDFAKIEAGQISVNQQNFSLNTLLNQVHSFFNTTIIQNNKINVRLDVMTDMDDDNSYIESDPNRLRQIFTNLIGNAFKFTDNGIIEFGYSKPENDKLLFYVKDTGIGIPEEKLNVIFNRFIQADDSSTRRYGGSGLGLAISKGLVELLGGEMWAESAVNVGSTFFFNIPYKKSEKIEQEDLSVRLSKTDYSWDGRVFLIAEDDKFSYKFLESFLMRTNADVLHAKDGKEAVDICKTNKDIDLVLMDIQMPEMNGLQATEEIKKFNKRLPIIAQTANAIIEEKQKCFDAGCDDFITKPVNISELFSLIDRWLSIK